MRAATPRGRLLISRKFRQSLKYMDYSVWLIKLAFYWSNQLYIFNGFLKILCQIFCVVLVESLSLVEQTTKLDEKSRKLVGISFMLATYRPKSIQRSSSSSLNIQRSQGKEKLCEFEKTSSTVRLIIQIYTYTLYNFQLINCLIRRNFCC